MTINGTGLWDRINWPWPQVRFLEYYTLGFAIIESNLHLFEMYCNSSDEWQASDMIDLGLHSDITQIDIAESGQFYLLNTYGDGGINSYIRVPGDSGTITQLPTSSIPESIACCNYNGQFLIGGILHGDEPKFADMGLNTVAWGQIGRVEFRIDNQVTRTAGYMNMPWGERRTGTIWKIKKIGNRLIIYGDGGKAVLTPINTPISGYGIHRMDGFGVRSGNHIDGDENVHGFISSDYNWYTVNKEAQFTKHGYQEFMQDLVENGLTRVSYEPQSKRFYISNGIKGYVFNQWGLYSTHQLVTSIGNYRGKTLCGFFDIGDDNGFKLVTDILDFKIRGLKTLETMEVGCDSSTEVRVGVDFRYNKMENFERGDLKRTNPRGGAAILKTASEFRLIIQSDSYSEMNLDYINMNIKVVDKRMIRGMYSKG